MIEDMPKNDDHHLINPIHAAPHPSSKQQQHQDIFNFTHQKVDLVDDEGQKKEPHEQSSVFKPSEPHMKKTNHNPIKRSAFEYPDEDSD
jgi:hypothetical protein